MNSRNRLIAARFVTAGLGILWLAVMLALHPATCRAADAAPPLPAVKDLPEIKEMPDPLTFRNGKKVTTPAEWKLRREEMKQIMEEYEYGHMPPPPGNVKGRVVRSMTLVNGKVRYRLVRLTFGPQEKLGFDLAIFTPVETTTSTFRKPYPAFVNLTFGADEMAAYQYLNVFSRGYAMVNINYGDLGADSRNYRSTGFFSAFPTYDWNDISAWAWGFSRAVDYLQDDPLIDKSKLIALGVSRCGQAVLLAGAFDERIAISAPVAGGMAMRFSGKTRGGGQGIDEVEDQNTYWFGPKLVEFHGQTDKLPCDQHWLPALTAPRGFIMCNSLADQYGNPYAALQSYLGAKPVYAFLGAPDMLGLNFRPGGHGMQAADWNTILDFADLHFRKIAAKRRFDQYPPDEQLHEGK